MASSATDLDLFKYGTTKLITALPDEIDEETAIFTIRHLLNTKEFEQSIASQVWNFRPFEVLLDLWHQQEALEGTLFITDNVLFHILTDASKANYFFEPQNFEMFAKMLKAFGPKLDQNVTVGSIASILDMVAVRASSTSLVHQLLVAGLIDMRSNGYKITVNSQSLL
ncbi:hypothetical protein N0V94_002670 [Neodidymelliopsis sp. IMI 364377]|nr:hypothetical protein N0V94_002670 [Neodidymelliopsis sp. IMI 364377]